jgi:tyrosyl-tRNA synthetase
MPDEMAEITLEADGAGQIGIVELLRRAQLQKSNSEARRVVEQGGVKVDGSRANLDTVVKTSGEQTLQVGKRTYARIRWR